MTVPNAPRERAPAPVKFVAGGEHLALLSLGSAPAEMNGAAVSVVRVARAALHASDALVVFVPLAPALGALPSDAERDTAHRLVDAGADVVIGQGSYVARPVEHYHGAVVAYSLGATLLSPELDLVAREATGIALRVQFGGGRALHFELVPLAVDDRSRPHLGRLDSAPADIPPGFAPFATAFARAHANAKHGSVSMPLSYETMSPPSALEALWAREVKRWIPWSAPEAAPKPFIARFGRGSSFASLRSVTSLGVPAAALELDATPESSVELEFPPLALGDRLEVRYALPDDREQSKYRPLFDEDVGVSVNGGPSFRARQPFHGGWQSAVLDTTALAGTERRVRVGVSSPATHFPVAFELRVEPRAAPE